MLLVNVLTPPIDCEPEVLTTVLSTSIVPVEVIVPPVIPFVVAIEVTPELVTYLPSRSTVTALRPDLLSVNTPVDVLKDAELK